MVTTIPLIRSITPKDQRCQHPRMRYVQYQDSDPEEIGTRWGGDGDIRTMQRHKQRNRRVPQNRAPALVKRRSPLDHIRSQGRCVVHPDLPLTAYSHTLPWEALLRIVMAPIDCPICISTSSVPRMLECGHVLCLPCFYRFWRHSEDHYCPICGEHVNGQLLAVSFMDFDPLFMPQPGHETVLKLMSKRDTVALPTGEELDEAKPKPEMLLYSRVVRATLGYLRQEYVLERDKLEQEQREALEEYGDDEGYSEALDSVRKKLQSKLEPLAKLPSTGDENLKGINAGLTAPAQYFYQTAFESPITFIPSHLDVSLLKAAFGDYSRFPTTIITKVENINYTSFEQDPSLRKWFRYLSHLPDTAPLGIIECDWRGILPPEALNKYRKALNERRSKTQQRFQKEEENRLKAQTEMDALFRLAARDDAPLPLDQLEINKASLPTLGDRNTPKNTKPKIWNKHLADRQEVQYLFDTAQEKKGKKGKPNRLVIQ